jgi:hypothetical protein
MANTPTIDRIVDVEAPTTRCSNTRSDDWAAVSAEP